MTEDGATANGKEQIRNESDHPEVLLFPDSENPDLKHVESRLLHFIDRRLPIEAALELGAEALAEDQQTIAEALDVLVCRGLLRFCAGYLEQPGVDDIYNENGRPQNAGGPPQIPLDAAKDPKNKGMDAIYREWIAIADRHPEWTARISPGTEGPVRINLDDPQGTMHALRDVFEYDEASVRPEDQAEFQRFLELDRQIEEFERGGGRDAKSFLRAKAVYRLLGGKCAEIGFVRGRLRAVRGMDLTPGRGDLTHALAEEMSFSQHGTPLNTLPLDEQLRLLEKAEQESWKRVPIFTNAGFDDMNDQPPPPDEKAPEGYERVTEDGGKSYWRPKNQPGTQVKVERPQ